jgi:hypothetical protein
MIQSSSQFDLTVDAADAILNGSLLQNALVCTALGDGVAVLRAGEARQQKGGKDNSQQLTSMD